MRIRKRLGTFLERVKIPLETCFLLFMGLAAITGGVLQLIIWVTPSDATVT